MPRITREHWIHVKKIAHRGLHDSHSPENTFSAYQKAIDNDYAIEIDIHITADNQVVVFHDDNLIRATNGENSSIIEETPYSELATVKLFGCDETMPLFADLLKFIDGRVPLLIEFKKIKNQDYSLEIEANKILLSYSGDYAVQSFNPYTLLWYKQNRPEILRGQLSSFFEEKSNLSRIVRGVLKRMKFNKKTMPDFISYDQKNLPNKYVFKYVSKCNIPTLAWTVCNEEIYRRVKPYCSNIIFEGFIPNN